MNYSSTQPSISRLTRILVGSMACLLLLFVTQRTNAQTNPQTITISGACLNGSYVLNKLADNFEGTNRPAYTGSGSVTIGPTTYPGTALAVYYAVASPGPAWIMSLDGQPYQSNTSTATLPPTSGWVAYNNPGGVGSCTGAGPLAVVTPNPSPSASINAKTNVGCNGGSNGSATVTATGGTPGYSYNWLPGNPTGDGTATVTGLTAGNYTVIVTDANSQTASATVSITQPAPIGITLSSTTNIACNGGSNGAASINMPTGGTPGYSYNWQPGNPTGDGTRSVSGLTAGSYTVTVTDANGCTAVSTTINITQPANPVTLAGSQTNVTTNGGSDGRATVNASGGTPGYSYNWQPGNPTGDGTRSVSGLTAGSYTVTVTDANSCAANTTFTITEPAPVPIVTTEPMNKTVCIGSSTAFSVVATNATGYQWQVNSGSGFTNLSNVSPYAGVLTPVLTISDVTGLNNYQYRCVVMGISSSVNSGAATLTVSPLPVPALGSNFGGTLTCAQTSLTLTASGGVSYTFANGSGTLGTPGSTNTLVVSTPGMYSVTAANASGCRATTSATVSEDKNAPTMPTLTASPSTTLTCAQTSLTLTASATGTGLSYAFSGPGGSLPDTGNSRAVSVAGTYSVTVTGANGCTTSQNIVIYSNTTAPAATLTASSTAVCSPASITLTAGGGVSYTFSAGASQIGTTNQAVVSQSGTYTVTVSGVNGCTSTASLLLTVNPRPDAPVLTGASRSIIQSNTPRSLLDFVTADNGNTLSFSGLSGLLDPPIANVSQTGVQNFQVTQTNASGCTSLATPFSLTVGPSIPTAQTVCRSSPTVLTSITPGSRYEWYKNGTSAPFKLTEIASIQKGTRTASLTVVSPQTTASYYLKIFAANGSFVFEGPFNVAVDYNCTTPGARQAAPELAEVPLSVVLLPNPIADGQVRAVVRGAGGQSLRVTLLNVQGQPAGEQHWIIAGPEQTVELSTDRQPSGMYLLQAQTPGRRTIVRVIKP